MSNGIYIEAQQSARDIAELCRLLVERFGQDPAKFHVRLR